MYVDAVTDWLNQVTGLNHSREVFAGVFFVLDLILVGVLLIYITINFSKRERNVGRAILSLLLYFAGQGLIRFWAWSNLSFRQDGGTNIIDYQKYAIYLSGSLMSVLGITFMIHYLTPPEYKPWNWLIGLPLGCLILYLTRT